ncbi:hypothetical protein [Flocculibacter collagenilyticus]|uniref:hypothetical protein n=1 Tax=Flocculibacter collagenilyticus TaxID=2744479 RepID=UPI0018F3960A|nr:hypothetical protein [Flocculibacter collagenilyticus]
MIKTITTATLLVGSLLTAAAPVMADTAVMKNFRKIIPHPTYGTDLWISITLKAVDEIVVEDYENSYDDQLIPLNTGKQVFRLDCSVGTTKFAPLSTYFYGDTLVTLDVEDGKEYELIATHIHSVAGRYDTVSCIPGFKVN